MQWPKVDEFLNEVCNQVRYKKAHRHIKEELKSHIEDRTSDYMEQGYDEEKAVSKAIDNMGDAKELGKKLNKQHKPYLGWALFAVNTAIVLSTILIIHIVGAHIYYSLVPLKDSPNKEDIQYSIKINKKDKIDDRTVTIKELVVDKKGIVYIYYKDISRPRFFGYSLHYPFDIYDNLGNQYVPEEINGQDNLFGTRYIMKLEGINKNASELILDYDYYNRKMRFEIPIKEGDSL